MDTQDYNCPPIRGLDGEYYMPGTVDYHAAATLPPEKVVVGYLNSDTTPQIVAEAMRMLITGTSNLPTTYTMQKRGGYPICGRDVLDHRRRSP